MKMTQDRAHAKMFIVEDVPALATLIVDYKQYELCRGDMIVCEWESGYRTQGLYFFDGRKVIRQNCDYDDYGTVPAEFDVISQFPPGYWDLSEDAEDGTIKFSVLKVSSYKGAVTIEPAALNTLPVYWHSEYSSGIHELHTGPNSPVKILSTEGFDYRGEYGDITILSYDGKKYLVAGSAIDGSTDVKTYVYCIKNGATGNINVDPLLPALSRFKIPPENILVVSGVY